MKLSNIAKLILGTSLVLSLGSVAMAAPSDDYGVTAEQRTKLEQLHKEHYAATDATRQQLIVKRAELNAQMQSQKPNSAKIEELSQELGTLEGKMRVSRVALNDRLEKENLPTMGHGYRGGKYGHNGGGKYGHNGGGKGHYGSKHGHNGGGRSDRGDCMGGRY